MTTNPPTKDQTMSATDTQVGGNHYKELAIQPVEYIHANSIGYFEGNVIKYVTRWKAKGGIKDLEKAKHYIELLIEMESKELKPIESNDGWIEWRGDEQPVEDGTIVDVKFRDGEILENVVAGESVHGMSRNASDVFWITDDEPNCITAYRVVPQPEA